MSKTKLQGANLDSLAQATGVPETLLSTLSSETGQLLLDRENDRHRGQKRSVGRPSTGSAIGTESSQYIRATSVVNKTQWAKLQTISKMEGVSLKTLLEAVYSLSISNYEEKRGEVKVSKGGDLSSILS